MGRRQLKRYLYISQTKVDMAFEQIKEPVLRRIAGTLRFDLPPFGVSVGSKPPRDTLIKRLLVVEEHLDRGGVIGTIQAPLTYLRGSMRLVEAEIGGDQPILVYAGRQDDAVVALTGSISHAVGRREKEAMGSRVASLDNAFAREVRPPAPRRTKVSAERAAKEPFDLIEWIVEVRGHLAESVDFVTEVTSVTERTDRDGKAVVFLVGTPLYVALAN